MSGIHARARKAVDEIEAELQRLGRWATQSPPAEAFVDMGPFGMETLTPEQWLQFVLIPRVREVTSAGGEFPAGSEVGVWATRNFDGDPDVDRLLQLLRAFDALFVEGSESPPWNRDDVGPPSAADGLPPPDPALTRLTARLLQHLPGLPAVKSAYLAQLHFPNTGQLTSPVLGLELDGPLATDAFAALGPSDPFIAMVVGEDAISRLMRLGTPIYVRSPPFHVHPDKG